MDTILNSTKGLENSTWITETGWYCLINLITLYFNMTTAKIISHEDITPLARQIESTAYIIDHGDNHSVPERVDLIIIAKKLQKEDLLGTYGKVVVFTKDLESSKFLWVQHRLPDTIVLTSNKNAVDAYTWFPYHPAKCHQPLQLELLDTCTEQHTWTNDLFPIKMPRQFGGCPVYYRVNDSFPESYQTSPGVYEGREVELMETLAEALNLTVIYRPQTKDFYLPQTFGTAHTAMIKRGEVDFAFAAVAFSFRHYKLVDALPVHQSYPIVWMLPKARPKSRVSGIYSGFSLELWIAVAIALIGMGIVMAIVPKAKRSSLEWIDLIAATLAISISNHSSPLNKNFIFLQFYFLHIVWFYQGTLLANICQTPLERQLTTPSEAVAAGLRPHLHAWMERGKFFNNSEHELWNKILVPGKFVLSTPLNPDDVMKGKGFMLASLVRDGYIMRKRYRQNLAKMVYVTKPFVVIENVIYASRGSPLTTRYKTQMIRAIESGILSHYSVIQGGFRDEVIQESSTLEVLVLEQFEGAFIICGLLFMLSSVVFIGELSRNFWKGKRPQGALIRVPHEVVLPKKQVE